MFLVVAISPHQLRQLIYLRAFSYLFSPPRAVATFCFHPSPLSIDSLNRFKNAVILFNGSSEFEHKHQEHIRLMQSEII